MFQNGRVKDIYEGDIYVPTSLDEPITTLVTPSEVTDETLEEGDVS